jgi:alpha-galactosidase
MSIKIAMIGAGSIGFTRRLMRDVLAVPELRDTTFALMDISAQNLSMVTQLCQKDLQSSGVPAKMISTMDRRTAIAESDYVISTIRQGGLEAFQLDIDIPLKYGIDQCVGDTICAGGIMYAQRTIPELLDFCKDIREVAKPETLFINYSNPMAMNTWACNKYGGVKMVGLCHGVQGAHWQITECIEIWAKRQGLLSPDAKLHRRDVQVIAAGLNHQTWFIKV